MVRMDRNALLESEDWMSVVETTLFIKLQRKYEDNVENQFKHVDQVKNDEVISLT